MALTEHYYTRFETGYFYHVYNRAVDRKPMFKNEGNYAFFLKKYKQYLTPVVDTFAYCMLGNHFHLMIRIKDTSSFKLSSNAFKKPVKSTHDIVSHQFRKFFQSYALAFNKQQNRIGTLFQTPFKRALVDSTHYLIRLVRYIHANPQAHGLVEDFREWKWSSYSHMFTSKPSVLKKHEVMNWFGNADNYIRFHVSSHKTGQSIAGNYIIDDDL